MPSATVYTFHIPAPFLLLSSYYTVNARACQLDSGDWTINKVTGSFLIQKYIICAELTIVFENVYVTGVYTHADVDV